MVLWLVLAAQGDLAEQIVREEAGLMRSELRLSLAKAMVRPDLTEAKRLELALSQINAAFLQDQLTYFASDGLKGRCAGTENERRGNDHIVRHFTAAGLKPVGDDGTYFQAFTFSGRSSRNCVGILEGSDLKDQIVVIGAHHDHVGTADDGHRGQIGGAQRDDVIWNGADDNGTGSTAIMAIVRAFGLAGLKPRRTILFMTFGAEEWGLLGSKHYAAHPIYPIEKHAAMINMDMIGRNPDKGVEVYGLGTAEIYPALLADQAKATGLKIDPIDGVRLRQGGDSDHTSFYRAGVPALFFFAGFHADYHRVTDSPEKIDNDHQARIARTAALILWNLANRDDAPVYKKVDAAVAPPVRGKTLGIQIGEIADADLNEMGLGPDEGGVMVSEVTEGGAAATAGIKKGDVLVSVAGKNLPRKDARGGLRDAMHALGGKQADLEFVRGGKRLKVTVKWE